MVYYFTGNSGVEKEVSSARLELTERRQDDVVAALGDAVASGDIAVDTHLMVVILVAVRHLVAATALLKPSEPDSCRVLNTRESVTGHPSSDEIRSDRHQGRHPPQNLSNVC